MHPNPSESNPYSSFEDDSYRLFLGEKFLAPKSSSGGSSLSSACTGGQPQKAAMVDAVFKHSQYQIVCIGGGRDVDGFSPETLCYARRFLTQGGLLKVLAPLDDKVSPFYFYDELKALNSTQVQFFENEPALNKLVELRTNPKTDFGFALLSDFQHSLHQAYSTEWLNFRFHDRAYHRDFMTAFDNFLALG